MHITMLQTQLGSRDGILCETFVEGQDYDLTGTDGSRDLAAVFVREGWAAEAKSSPVESDSDAEPQADTGRRKKR